MLGLSPTKHQKSSRASPHPAPRSQRPRVYRDGVGTFSVLEPVACHWRHSTWGHKAVYDVHSKAPLTRSAWDVFVHKETSSGTVLHSIPCARLCRTSTSSGNFGSLRPHSERPFAPRHLASQGSAQSQSQSQVPHIPSLAPLSTQNGAGCLFLSGPVCSPSHPGCLPARSACPCPCQRTNKGTNTHRRTRAGLVLRPSSLPVITPRGLVISAAAGARKGLERY